MKVIFLDVDGVLNSTAYYSQQHTLDDIYTYLDPSKLKLLKYIVEETGASIVLSSSWRIAFDDRLVPTSYMGESLYYALDRVGLTLLDKTSTIDLDRYAEVKLWLLQHPEVESFVILDDANFGWKDFTNHWVRTSYSEGLSEEQAYQAIEILKKTK